MSVTIRPCTLAAARRFVALHHAHNDPPIGHIFSTSAVIESVTVAVGIAGRPVARKLDTGAAMEITRVCVAEKGSCPNVCSQIYGRLRRAGDALGYAPIYTYTLAEENAACVRAAGFRRDADVPARPTWDMPSRRREDVGLFGNAKRPTGDKTRWVWP